MALSLLEPVQRQPGYVDCGDIRLFSWLHYCDTHQYSDTGVIICPPLGVDYMSSHRGLRHLADEYARAGFVSMRIDYLGCGDSADADPEMNQLEIQIQSILSALAYLKNNLGLKKVGLFGFKFGATIASLASVRTDLEFLTLWAPVIRGKRYLREITLLQQMNIQQSETQQLEAGGLVINPETRSAWEKVDLSKLSPNCSRAFVIPADEVTNEDRLCLSWKNAGCDTEQIDLEGSSDLLVDSHFTKIPTTTLRSIVQLPAEVIRNSSRLDSFEGRYNTMMVSGATECTQIYKDISLRETVHVGTRDSIFYILVEPKQIDPNLPIIVLLNSGANHHVGPNRIYVTLTRLLASMGFTCVRVDLPGLGDGYLDDPERENITYIPNMSGHIGTLLDELQSSNQKGSFVLAGLCSGAYGSHVSAIELGDHNILESLLINPLTFYWEEGMRLEAAPSINYQNWEWYMQSLKQPSSWLKLIKGKVHFRVLISSISRRFQIKFGALKNRFKYNSSHADPNFVSMDLSADLRKIENKNIHLSLVLADRDPGRDILMTNAASTVKSMLNNKTMSLYGIDNADHTFSMQPARCRVVSVITEHLKTRYLN